MNFHVKNLLANKHIQTSYATLFRKPFLQDFEIEEFSLSDGDFVEIYWYNKQRYPKKIAVLFHGLAGSYLSPYIQGAVNEFTKKGYTSAVVHFRGCGTKPNRKARSYHSGETQDNLEVLHSIHTRYADAKIFCVGYSLGANMLLKLLGEQGEKSFITAAVAVSAPMELAVAAKTINQGTAKIYQRRLLKELKDSLLQKFNRFDFHKLINLSQEDVKNIQSIREFDALYTAPIHGFLSAQDYYERSSAKQFLKDIRIPTLIIHAKDDPFMTTEVLPKKDEISPYITLEISEKGGHVGFVEGTLLKPEYWLEKRVVSFFELFFT
jgi:hypothetical protein